MRSVLFGALSFAAVLGASAVHEAQAAPVVAVAPLSAYGPNGSPIEPVYYYYRGQRYPYRYGGRYYHHRYYRHGHWHYY